MAARLSYSWLFIYLFFIAQCVRSSSLQNVWFWPVQIQYEARTQIRNRLDSHNQVGATNWLARPWNLTLSIILAVSGLQYISSPVIRLLILLLHNILSTVAAGSSDLRQVWRTKMAASLSK